jgi:hypothetical protein
MKKALLFITTLCCVALASPFVFAANDAATVNDVILLKNGNRIEGLIARETDNEIALERPSAQKNRFYTVRISKKEISEIQQMPVEVRQAVQEQRRKAKAAELAKRQAAASQAKPVAAVRPVETHHRPFGRIETRAAAPASSRAIGGGYGSGGAGGGYGTGGYGGGGFGAGGYGGGGFGAGQQGGAYGGGFGGGGYGGGYGGGGGSVTFSNIMQLFVPVNHALVGEVEPVIGLQAQMYGTGQQQNVYQQPNR